MYGQGRSLVVTRHGLKVCKWLYGLCVSSMCCQITSVMYRWIFMGGYSYVL